MTAFVLDLSENGYGIVRSLAGAHVPVVGFHRSNRSFGRFSRLCEARPLEACDDDALCRVLIDNARHSEGKPALFPTSDDQVAFLVRNQERLKEHFSYYWLPVTAWREIVDKRWMAVVANRAGVLVPRSHTPERPDEVEREASNFVFPCIIKPGQSNDPRFPKGLKNFVAHSIQDLLQFYEDREDAIGATIWQEVVEGGDDQIFQCNVLVNSTGEIAAHVCVRKIRQYLPGYGVMCFGRTEHNPQLLREAAKLLRFLDYRGLASLEFKWRERDERFFFIEMNPRLPWYNALFLDAGVNLANLAYIDLLGETVPRIGPQRDKVYWAAFRQDLGHQVRQRNNPARWLTSLARTRSWAWWCPKDPLPFWHATLDFVLRRG